jgi:hypothetical protein
VSPHKIAKRTERERERETDDGVLELFGVVHVLYGGAAALVQVLEVFRPGESELVCVPSA